MQHLTNKNAREKDPSRKGPANANLTEARGRVLISGAHQDTRYMMRVLLEMWGYEVIEANGESETVELAESSFPDAILVDTSRRSESDLQIVSSVRRSRVPRSVPVIVISGYP